MTTKEEIGQPHMWLRFKFEGSKGDRARKNGLPKNIDVFARDSSYIPQNFIREDPVHGLRGFKHRARWKQ